MSIFERIKEINEEWGLPVPKEPTDLGARRIWEMFEFGDESVPYASAALPGEGILVQELREAEELTRYMPEVMRLVGMADLLGDIIYYCYSEGARWGIPMDQVMTAILHSQLSKRFPDGTFHRDKQNKVIKGPNYVAPEKNIEEIIINGRSNGGSS